MPLDPLIAFGLMLLLWAVGISYVLYMAAREERRRRQRAAKVPVRR